MMSEKSKPKRKDNHCNDKERFHVSASTVGTPFDESFLRNIGKQSQIEDSIFEESQELKDSEYPELVELDAESDAARKDNQSTLSVCSSTVHPGYFHSNLSSANDLLSNLRSYVTSDSDETNDNWNLVVLGCYQSEKHNLSYWLRTQFRSSSINDDSSTPLIWDVANLSPHNCFFPNRTIFIIAWNIDAAIGRDTRDGDIQHWLTFVEARRPGSIILIVGTHDDNRREVLEYDVIMDSIRNRFEAYGRWFLRMSFAEEDSELLGRSLQSPSRLSSFSNLNDIISPVGFVRSTSFPTAGPYGSSNSNYPMGLSIPLARVQSFGYNPTRTITPDLASPSFHFNHGRSALHVSSSVSEDDQQFLFDFEPDDEPIIKSQSLCSISNSGLSTPHSIGDDVSHDAIQNHVAVGTIFALVDHIKKLLNRATRQNMRLSVKGWSTPEIPKGLSPREFEDFNQVLENIQVKVCTLARLYELLSIPISDDSSLQKMIDYWSDVGWLMRLDIVNNCNGSSIPSDYPLERVVLLILDLNWFCTCLEPLSSPDTFLDWPSNVAWSRIRSKFIRSKFTEPMDLSAKFNIQSMDIHSVDGIIFNNVLRLILEEMNIIYPSSTNSTNLNIDTIFRIENVSDIDDNDSFILRPVLRATTIEKFQNHFPKTGSLIMEQVFQLSFPSSPSSSDHYIIPRVLAQIMRESRMDCKLQHAWSNAFVVEIDSLTISVVRESPTLIRISGEGFIMFVQRILSILKSVGDIITQMTSVQSRYHVCPICLMKHKKKIDCGTIPFSEAPDIRHILVSNYLDNSTLERIASEFQSAVTACSRHQCPIRFDFLFAVDDELFVKLFPKYDDSLLSYMTCLVNPFSRKSSQGNEDLFDQQIKTMEHGLGPPLKTLSFNMFPRNVLNRSNILNWPSKIGSSAATLNAIICVVYDKDHSTDSYLLSASHFSAEETTLLNIDTTKMIISKRVSNRRDIGIICICKLLDRRDYHPMELQDSKVSSRYEIGRSFLCWNRFGDDIVPLWARIVCELPRDDVNQHDRQQIYLVATRGECQTGSPVTNDLSQIIGLVLRPAEACNLYYIALVYQALLA